MSKTSNQETNAVARNKVSAELARRGVTDVRESRYLNRPVLKGKGPEGQHYTFIIKAKTSGSWQVGLSDGAAERIRPNVIWVLVDLGAVIGPRFFVAPDRDIRSGISENHAAYLQQHGGTRPANPDSPHHAIEVEHVASWEGRWDLIAGVRAGR